MIRRHNKLQDMDMTLWPQVDINALSPAQRVIFTRRQQAIQLYAAGETIILIERQTGIDRRQLYSLLDRCLTSDVDGSVIGFPALIK
jgi:putative transposase